MEKELILSNYHCCIDCDDLNKKEKQVSDVGNYRYGCKSNRYTCGWMKKDSKMKEMGCSRWREIGKVTEIYKYEQITLF